MEFHYLLLPTDALFYLLIILGLGATYLIVRNPIWREAWQRIFACNWVLVSALILFSYIFIALIDSVHFEVTIANQHHLYSGLDLWLSPLDQQDEKTYSAPFALHSYVKEVIQDHTGKWQSVQPRLMYGGADLIDPSHRTQHIFSVILHSTKHVALFFALIFLLIAALKSVIKQQSLITTFKKFWNTSTDRISWRVCLLTLFIISLFLINAAALSEHYHILGTDKVGDDVFYQSIKSIRTGIIIGTVTTLVMLPFAIILGIAAGYFGGWIDDAIQYVYTTLSSIPGVLLIAASILGLQVFISNHSDLFPRVEYTADARLLALCMILGITSWTSLCRILRAETLKLREMDFIHAAKILGVKSFTILWRHLLPNVMPLVLIATILDFSGLVLAEAVLSYVGVGVDPTTMSWGNMINSARLELAREPLVWWPLLAAFFFMFFLVLSANLFSDAVREAFDPKS